MTNVRQSDIEDIMVANNDIVKVKSAGETTLNLQNVKIHISEVLHVPDLGVN